MYTWHNNKMIAGSSKNLETFLKLKMIGSKNQRAKSRILTLCSMDEIVCQVFEVLMC